jgi:hypothetical protein
MAHTRVRYLLQIKAAHINYPNIATLSIECILVDNLAILVIYDPNSTNITCTVYLYLLSKKQ